MTASRAELLHAARVGVETARHALDRADPAAIAEARRQLDDALARLAELAAVEASPSN